MDVQPLIDRLDTLIHHHIDTLQIVVLQGHKYANIAQTLPTTYHTRAILKLHHHGIRVRLTAWLLRQTKNLRQFPD